MTLVEFLLARIAEDEAAAEYLAHIWPTDRKEMTLLHWHVPSPSYLLAECESKRRIVDLHIEGDALKKRGWVGFRSSETLRLLALPYTNHPDFNRKWSITAPVSV